MCRYGSSGQTHLDTWTPGILSEWLIPQQRRRARNVIFIRWSSVGLQLYFPGLLWQFGEFWLHGWFNFRFLVPSNPWRVLQDGSTNLNFPNRPGSSPTLTNLLVRRMKHSVDVLLTVPLLHLQEVLDPGDGDLALPHTRDSERNEQCHGEPDSVVQGQADKGGVRG